MLRRGRFAWFAVFLAASMQMMKMSHVPPISIKEENFMWLFTEAGFVSAVRHYSDSGVVVVRSRDEESLNELAGKADVQVEKSPYNDYPYRIHVKDEVFQSWLTEISQKMDYTNFKDRVYETRGEKFAHTLMGVWEIMHEVEDNCARKQQ